MAHTQYHLSLQQIPSATVRSDVMISVEYRHTNFNSYLQILDRQYISSTIMHFPLGTPDTLSRNPGVQRKPLWKNTDLAQCTHTLTANSQRFFILL